MAGENKIYYNGADLGSAVHHGAGHRMPTPMLSVSADMINLGERWGQTHKISLEGQLTGYFWGACGADQWEERNALILKFHENFRDLQVYEDGAEILSFPNCKVESINFSESTFSGDGGDTAGTHCCTASYKQKTMTISEVKELRRWHRQQSQVWQDGYDVWGKYVADGLVAKSKWQASVVKSVHDLLIKKKLTLKGIYGMIVISSGVYPIGLFKRITKYGRIFQST